MSQVDRQIRFDRLRERYDLPAVVEGQRLWYDGKPAVLTDVLPNGNLKLSFTRQWDRHLDKFEYHPLVHVDWGDGVDYAGLFPDDVRAWREAQGLPA